MRGSRDAVTSINRDHDDFAARSLWFDFLDPLDPELKKLAAPLYSEAARRAPRSRPPSRQRSNELEGAGYHAQVLATANSFPVSTWKEGGDTR